MSQPQKHSIKHLLQLSPSPPHAISHHETENLCKGKSEPDFPVGEPPPHLVENETSQVPYPKNGFTLFKGEFMLSKPYFHT